MMRRRVKFNNRIGTKDMVMAGLLLAIAVIVPSIFHNTGMPGKVFLPMHIPVLLGGFLLPPSLAFILGAVTPVINFLVTGMPPIFPTGIIMVFELGFYGLIASLLYRSLRLPSLISLIISMIIGRIVAGGVAYILLILFKIEIDPILSVKLGLITGIPGIIIQLILIPVLIYGINKYTFINHD